MDQGVGREVKRLREERGWSRTKLAAEADMSASGVTMIENGQRNLTTTTLAKLAGALGVEVRDLFPLGQAPLPLEEGGRRDAEAVPDEHFEEFGHDLFDLWEGELEQKLSLARSNPAAFFVWVQGIRNVGGPYVRRLVEHHAAMAGGGLEAVIGMAALMGRWRDLWHRLEEETESEPGLRMGADDEEKLRKILEEARTAAGPS